MPVTTRGQAQKDGDQSNSPPRGGNNFQQLATRSKFDEGTTYHPVFCLVEVPDEYFDELEKYTDENSPCLEITSNDTNDVLAEVKANIGRSRPAPFLGWTVDQVYIFYKKHLRPAEDYSGPGEHFTRFTFIIVDEECIKSSPLQCILCSDAPDFGEAETKLKQLRLPMEKAVEHLCALEQLCFTMSTIEHPSGLSLSIMPPPIMKPVLDQPGAYKVATAAEARENKKEAISAFSSADEALGSS